jgi:hypothetical protein
MGVFHMSSLVDNIVLMNFIELGDTVSVARSGHRCRSGRGASRPYKCRQFGKAGHRQP